MVPQEYKDLLKEYVAIKSISTDPAFKDDVHKTAEWLSNLLSGYGFKTELIPGEITNPSVFATLEVDPKAETILVYGHYDVQPAEKADGWDTEPFELTEKDGRLFGRGSIDNKGQNLIHVYTVGKLAKEGKLKYNVKFLIEGNEETGNEELGEIVKKDAEKFACDYVVISDGETVQDRPTIDVGLRGGMNLTVKYKTAKTNFHSGIYGGAMPSAPMELMKLIGKLYNVDRTVAIPGFYDDAVAPTEAEIENNKGVEFTEKTLEELTGAKALLTEEGYDFYTQTGLRPMLTVTGFKSGYIGDGYANIVPGDAEARINFRFVVDQDPDKIYAAFEKFVSENTPEYVDWSIDRSSSWGAIKINVDQPKVQEAVEMLEKAYDAKVFKKYVGGSVPIVLDFKNALGKDTISISMANEDCNMHGANENFKIDLVEKGLKFSETFFAK